MFEQDTALGARPRDWNIGIYWAQSRLDECLSDDLKAQLETVQTDPSYKPNADSVMPVHNGQTGELLKNLPAPWSLRIHRRKWLKLLSKDVDVKVSGKIGASLQIVLMISSTASASRLWRLERILSQQSSKMAQRKLATFSLVPRAPILQLESSCSVQ